MISIPGCGGSEDYVSGCRSQRVCEEFGCYYECIETVAARTQTCR